LGVFFTTLQISIVIKQIKKRYKVFIHKAFVVKQFMLSWILKKSDKNSNKNSYFLASNIVKKGNYHLA